MESKKTSLEENFRDFRKEWTEIIKDHAFSLKDISKLTDSQVNCLSDRQFLVEYISKLTHTYHKSNKEFREKKYEILEEKTNGSNLRYNAKEKEIIIEGELASMYFKMEMIDNQISFAKESLKTIDSIIYNISNRIKLQDYVI